MAAVAGIAARERGLGRILRHGAVWGLGHVALFGLGSIAGMALLSTAIAVPLSYTASFLTWANRGLQAAIGTATITLGVIVLQDTGPRLAPLP